MNRYFEICSLVLSILAKLVGHKTGSPATQVMLDRSNVPSREYSCWDLLTRHVWKKRYSFCSLLGRKAFMRDATLSGEMRSDGGIGKVGWCFRGWCIAATVGNNVVF
jgi:hypothetical protein